MKPTRINRFAILPLSASSLSSAGQARQGSLRRLASIPSLVLFLAGAQSAQAADFFWDPASSGTNAGSGSGTWDSANTNWFDGVASANVSWADGNRPVFGGAAGPYEVMVADNFSTTGGLLFSSTGYTLSAASPQTITSTSSNTTLGGGGVTATIGSNVTVTRASNDTITGTGGILNIGGAYVNSQAGSTGGRTLNINIGATVNVNSGGYFGQSAATVYTATNVNGTTIGVGTNASGGSLVVKSGGTVTAGNNTHVVVGLGTAVSGTLTIDGGEVNGGAITNTSDTPGPSVPQSPANYGGLRFGSTNSVSGTRIANLNGGNLTVGQVFIGSQAGGSTATNTFNFNGGTLKAIISNTTFMTGLTAANVQVGGAKVDTNGFDITIGQALIHDAALDATLDGGLTKSSAGALTLTASSTYTGDTNISGGTLRISGSGRLNAGNYAGAMSIAPSATFESATSASQTLSGAITGGGTLKNVGGGGLILSNGSNSYGALSISNANSRVFINTNATALPAAATVEITSGALVFAAPATRDNAITVSSGGVLSARATTTLSNVTLPGSGSVIFNNDDANTSLLTISNGQTLTGDLTVQVGGSRMAIATTALGAVTLSGNLTGGGGLVVASSGNFANNPTLFGTGVLTLAGTNDYTGPTTVTAGTLAVTGSLGATAVTVNSPATLGGNGNIGGDVTINAGATHALAVAATPGAQVTRAITGTLTLTAGNLLNLTAAATPAAGEYVLATAPTITGTTAPLDINYNGINGVVSVDTANNPNRLLLTAVASGFSAWIEGPFTNAIPVDERGPNDDPDNDGISNLVEYAIAGEDPTVSKASIGSFNGTLLSFSKRLDASGLTYAIQDSTDLGIADIWAEVGSYTENTASTISYTLTPGTPVRNFLRLQVFSN